MKRFFRWLKKLFFPPIGSTPVRRILPFALVAVLLLVIFVGGMFAWEATNTTLFCGTACHTMPPEYTTQQASSHASITCEDCHLGRAIIFEEIVRKVEYSWQTGTATLFNTYKYPIVAKNMRPANDACIPCHNPEKFSGDKVLEITQYASDVKNTMTDMLLILKTGGGTQRTGLGFGIHWHIENPVYFYATDAERQNIPYVRVMTADGKAVEYVDVQSGFDPTTIDSSKLQRMDCITCHNRTAHNILQPVDALNQMIARDLVSQTIPEIRKKALEVLTATYYTSQWQADTVIDGLEQYYRLNYSDYYVKNKDKIISAIGVLKGYYDNSVFYDQKVDWNTHPNNIGHQYSAGCFRCHDGKHLTTTGEAVRLECNLCHSIPVVSNPNQLVANIPVSKGIEPASHLNTNWIALHRQAFDSTCAGCHTVDDAGGTSNKSFCSNSACHGQTFQFAGFNAPKLREAIAGQLPTPAPTPTLAPTAVPTQTPVGQATAAPTKVGAKLTYADVAAIFEQCTPCHAAGGGPKGLDLSSYKAIMAGSDNGPVIVVGDPAKSTLVQVQSDAAAPHFVQFNAADLATIVRWIKDGALEK